MAAAGSTAIAEIQFADYIFPGFDQVCSSIVDPINLNEALLGEGRCTLVPSSEFHKQLCWHFLRF